LIWYNFNQHLPDKQGAKEAVLTVFFLTITLTMPSSRSDKYLTKQFQIAEFRVVLTD